MLVEDNLKFIRHGYYKVDIEKEYNYLLTFLKFDKNVIDMNMFIYYLESINDVALRSAQLTNFVESEYSKWLIDVFEESYSKWNLEAEEYFKDTKKSGTLSGTVNRERIENHIKSQYYKEVKELAHKKRRWQWQLSNMKALTKQIESRQSVLQTLAGLLKGRKWISGEEKINLNQYKQIINR